MERMALDKNNNESALLSTQDPWDNFLDEWTGEPSELPTLNPSETEIQSGDGEPPAKKARKEHRCDTCGKTLTRPNHLITHQRIHTGEKPYKCLRCDKQFRKKEDLNRHLKAHEKQAAQRTLTCETCGESFHNRAPFNAHEMDTDSAYIAISGRV